MKHLAEPQIHKELESHTPPSRCCHLQRVPSSGMSRANGLDLWDGHYSNRQRNGQGLADLTCTTDKPNVNFRGLFKLRNPRVLSPSTLAESLLRGPKRTFTSIFKPLAIPEISLC
jgi:hypothetical protein